LGGALLFGYFWARALAKGLFLQREMRFGWAQVGDLLEERFTLSNSGWAPAIWVELVDHSTLPDHNINWAIGIGSRSSVQWHTQGKCTRRGVFSLGPTSLRAADPLGIFMVELHDPATRTLVVMPPVVPLPAIQVAAGGRSGDGFPRPNAPERTVSSSSVREFQPGDSLHWIHWRTTARRRKPFVRIFDGTPAGDWRILLDMDTAAQVGEGWDSTAEHGVILAASLADRGLRLRRAVGLIVSSRELVWLAPDSNEAQRWAVLRALALVDAGERPLGMVLRRIESDIPSHTSIILITPAVQGDWLEALLPLIWRGVTPTVLLLDPRSYGREGDPAALPAVSPAASPAAMLALLERMGVAHTLITRDIFDRPEARPGTAGHEEWRVTPLGRAVLVRKPADTSWRRLG
jgi:uncharacterized protein (DUF58 family)